MKSRMPHRLLPAVLVAVLALGSFAPFADACGGYMGPEQIREALGQLTADDASVEQRRQAARMLGWVFDELTQEMIDALMTAATTDEDAQVRAHAIAALAGLAATNDQLDEKQRVIIPADRIRQLHAVERDSESADARRILLPVGLTLAGDNADRRDEAIRHIARMLTSDADARVRLQASWYLNPGTATERLAGDVVPALQAALADDDLQVRIAVLGALYGWEARAAAALPAVQALVEQTEADHGAEPADVQQRRLLELARKTIDKLTPADTTANG